MFRQGPHVLLWVWWRTGLFKQTGSPLRRMIFLITPPRRGEGGGGEPGLKGCILVWAEEAFTRALFSFVWMTLFPFVTLSFVDTMYPTNVYS